MMTATLRLAALACAIALAPAAAAAATAGALLGAPALDARGAPVGEVEELIVDVRDGRVLYVIVDSRGEFLTLPVRALRVAGERAVLDMSEAGEIARTGEPHLRRAGRLIGQPLHRPGGARLGTIVDFELDPAAGRIERVLVDTDDGERVRFPPGVLAHGRFPPLTRWQADHPPAQGAEDSGFLRREPSDERQRLHEHDWPRN